MFTRSFILAACATVASAFTAGPALPLSNARVAKASSVTMMAQDVDRRSVVGGAALAGAAVVAGASSAEAADKPAQGFLAPSTYDKFYNGKAKNSAPFVTVFDERGCNRPKKDYTGNKAGTYDDNMLVKVAMKGVGADLRAAEKVFDQFKPAKPTWRK